MDPLKLKDYLQALTQEPDLQPTMEDGVLVTRCNLGARKAAEFLGCLEFSDKNLMADDMVKIMGQNASGKWQLVDGQTAATFAISDGLAFAAMTSEELGEAHGHIACVFPAPMQFSGSLNKEIPMIANVGKRNGIMKVSEAFPVAKGESHYWTWTDDKQP